MKLEKLNPYEKSLTREQLLAIAGGNFPTLIFTRGVSNTEPDNVPDADDTADD